jgi:hypothetical protein
MSTGSGEVKEIQDSNAAAAHAFQYLSKRRSVFPRPSVYQDADHDLYYDSPTRVRPEIPITDPDTGTPWFAEATVPGGTMNLESVITFLENVLEDTKLEYTPRYTFYSEKSGIMEV